MTDDSGERDADLRCALRLFLKHYDLKPTPLALAAGLSENTLRLFLRDHSRTMTMSTLQKLAVAAAARLGIETERAEGEMQGKRPLLGSDPRSSREESKTRAQDEEVYNTQLMVQLLRQIAGKLDVIATSAQRCEDVLVHGLPPQPQNEPPPRRVANGDHPRRPRST
jgi:hypothetical protein